MHQGGFEESDNLKRLTVAELVTDRNHYRNILQPSLTNSFIDWLTNTFTCIKKSHIKGAGVHELEVWSRATSFRVSWYHATSLQVTQPLLSSLWSDIIKIIRQMRHQTWDIVKSCKLDFGHKSPSGEARIDDATECWHKKLPLTNCTFSAVAFCALCFLAVLYLVLHAKHFLLCV